jgi:hypothetical protein
LVSDIFSIEGSASHPFDYTYQIEQLRVALGVCLLVFSGDYEEKLRYSCVELQQREGFCSLWK